MTTPIPLTANGIDWLFARDDPQPPLAARSQAMLRAMLIDEVLAAPPALPISVATHVHDAVARAAAGGRVGVVGRPAQIFDTPISATCRIDLSIRAMGYLPLDLDEAVGPQPPDAFDPVDLGTITLHRQPVRIGGRVVSRSLGPLAGAAISINGVWPVLQHPMGAPDAANAMPALAGLYVDRPVGGTMRRRNLTTAAEVKTLARTATAGDTIIRLSDREAINAGQILAIDTDDIDRVEFVGISLIDTTSSADQPADFTLDLPLRRTHAAGLPAARAVSGAAGPPNALARPARRGDISVWTAGLAGIAAGTTAIEIDGGGNPPEFHATTRYDAATDARGAYLLPPIHRVAAVELRVSHAALAVPVTRAATLAWNASALTEDFIVP